VVNHKLFEFQKYNVNRNYNTFHKEKYGKYEAATRLEMSDLKSKLSKQKNVFLKSETNER
jgi:hypothetical protein